MVQRAWCIAHGVNVHCHTGTELKARGIPDLNLPTGRPGAPCEGFPIWNPHPAYPLLESCLSVSAQLSLTHTGSVRLLCLEGFAMKFKDNHEQLRVAPCSKPNFTCKPNKAKDKTQRNTTNRRSISGDQHYHCQIILMGGHDLLLALGCRL